MGRVRLGCEVNQPCATTKEVGEESSNLEDVEEAEGSRESCDLVVLDRIAKWSRIVANGLEGEIEVVIVTTGSFLLDDCSFLGAAGLKLRRRFSLHTDTGLTASHPSTHEIR